MLNDRILTRDLKGESMIEQQTGVKPVSRQVLYQLASLHSRDAIERLAKLMNSRNENVALGACRTLLDKVIPDLKLIGEVSGEAQLPIPILGGRSISHEKMEITIV